MSETLIPTDRKPMQRHESNAVIKRLELQKLFLLHLMELSKPPFWAVNVKWRLHSEDDSQNKSINQKVKKMKLKEINDILRKDAKVKAQRELKKNALRMVGSALELNETGLLDGVANLLKRKDPIAAEEIKALSRWVKEQG